MSLTPEECEIVSMLRDGMTRYEIAEELDVNPQTVRGIVRRIAFKLSPGQSVSVAQIPALADQQRACSTLELGGGSA